jgi:hypothetical protein
MKSVFKISVVGEDKQYFKKEVEGVAFDVPQLPGYKFFYFKHNVGYSLTEVESGFMLCNSRLLKELPELIANTLSRFGVDRTKQILDAHIEQYKNL